MYHGSPSQLEFEKFEKRKMVCYRESELSMPKKKTFFNVLLHIVLSQTFDILLQNVD